MRKLKIIVVLVLTVAFAATLTWAKVPKSTITGTAHDLRSTFNAAPFTLCTFCHIAHKAGDAPAGPGQLLWNHTLSSVASYGVYTSGSLDAADIADLGGQTTVSNLCLSCHDGTVAVNSFFEGVLGANFQPIAEGTTFMPQGDRIVDLSRQHPINFTFDANLASTDGGLIVPAGMDRVDTGGEVPLFNSKMQCATCHDPHNGGSGVFLRQFPTQASDSFCTFCHL